MSGDDFRDWQWDALSEKQPHISDDVAAAFERAIMIALEQRCERATVWDQACVTIAMKIRAAANMLRSDDGSQQTASGSAVPRAHGCDDLGRSECPHYGKCDCGSSAHNLHEIPAGASVAADLIAERCEQATGPDRELDALIAPLAGLRVVNEGHPLGRCCYDKRGHGVPLPAYTASLDAAITLVPEEMAWSVDSDGPTYPAGAEIGPYPTGGELFNPNHSASAETPALALCSAALRARAA